MSRAPIPHGRKTYRRALRGFLSRNRLLVAGVAAAVIVLGALCALTMRRYPYLLGFAHATLLAVGAGMLFLASMATTRALLWQMVGGWGEDNTREELRKATRRRTVWGWVDGVWVRSGDVDHIVVTASGVLALDSKWHAGPMTRAAAEQDAEVAVVAARRARSVLRSVHAARDVRPVVVVWGSGRDGVPPGAQVNGVDFVAGRNLARWLSDLPAGAIDERTAEAMLRALEQFRSRVRPST